MSNEWDNDAKTPWTPPEEVELMGLPGPFDHLAGRHLAPLVPEGTPEPFPAEKTERVPDSVKRAVALDHAAQEADIRTRCLGAMVEVITERSGLPEAQAVLGLVLRRMGL